jgi:hypothetical protein
MFLVSGALGAWVYGFALLRAEGRNLKMIDLQINKALSAGDFI